MALATRCPHCHTTFRVAADQLKLRGGIVRCGACKQVFDGNSALVDLSPPVPPDVPEFAVPGVTAPADSALSVGAAPADAAAPDSVAIDAPAHASVPALEEASLSAAFDAEIAALETRQQLDDKARAEEAASSEPIYTLDFDTTFDPFGIMPKVEAETATEAATEFESDLESEAATAAESEAAPTTADRAPEAPADRPSEYPSEELPDAPSDAEIVRAVSQLSEVDVAHAVDDLLNDELLAVAQPDDDELSDEALTDDELARAGLLHVGPALVTPAVTEPAVTGALVIDPEAVELAHVELAQIEPAQIEPADKHQSPAQAPPAILPHGPIMYDELAPIEFAPIKFGTAPAPHRAAAFDDASPAEQFDQPWIGQALTSPADPQAPVDDAGTETRPFKPAADGLAPMLMRASAATEPAPPAAPLIPPLAVLQHSPRKSKRKGAMAGARVEPPAVASAPPAAPPVEVDEPEFVKQVRIEEATGRTRRLALSGGAALLALMLVLQGAAIFRNVLAARHPSLKPALVVLCVPFGCKVELPAQIDALSVEAGELQPTGSGTFLFSSLLRNQSELTQAWPNLALELTDDNNKPLVRRVFTPADYLPPGSLVAKGFGARSEQSVRLKFALDQLKASGYTIAVFYP